MWPCVQRFVWLNGLNFFLVSHSFANFSGHGLCGSSDTTAKIAYVTLKDHLIKVSGDFIEGSSSLYIPTMPWLIARDIVLMGI